MEPPVRTASPAHGSCALGWISTLLRKPVANRPTAPAAWHGNSSEDELGKVEDAAEGFSRGTDSPCTFVTTDSPSVPFSYEPAEAILFLEQFWGRATQTLRPMTLTGVWGVLLFSVITSARLIIGSHPCPEHPSPRRAE